MLMNKMQIIIAALKKKAHVAVAAAASAWALFYYLTVMNVYQNSLQIFIQMNGFYFTIASLLLNAMIAVMIGVFAALLSYRYECAKKYGYSGTAATAVAIFSAGCPTCGSFLLGLAGFPLGLLALPLHGIELKIIALLALAASVNIASSSACKIRTKKQ